VSVAYAKRPLSEQLALLQELALQSLSYWGLSCKSLSLIKHRENAVYKLLTQDNELFAVRVHRSGYHSDAALNSEFVWMEALADVGIHVPQVLPCTNGERFAVVEHQEIPEPRQIDVLQWIAGEQLGSVENGLEGSAGEIAHIYSTVGTKMAHLHAHSSQWQLPQGFTRHAWDQAGLVGPTPLWGQFWELANLTPQQRSLISKARDAVAEKLSTTDRSSLNYGMIHADFVPENLLVDEGNVRVIDFDDAGLGWYMFDIATALFFIQDDANYEVAKSALINAYQSARKDFDCNPDALALFMLARSFTYLGWVHTRPDTETAVQLTPSLVDICCRLADAFIARERLPS
jgi:Ser/Thr protein kinase RdoA (MazF antagonist)